MGSAPRIVLPERLSTRSAARLGSDMTTYPRSVRLGSASPTMATAALASPHITPVQTQHPLSDAEPVQRGEVAGAARLHCGAASGPRQHGRAQHH